MWRDDGCVGFEGRRTKVSHVIRVREQFGRREALVALGTHEHGKKVREEGCEVWIELRRLPAQFRSIARCMQNERQRWVGGTAAGVAYSGRRLRRRASEEADLRFGLH